MTALPHSLVILLADDNANDVLLIRRAFKRLGNLAQVITVPDGDAAIAYLRGDGVYTTRATWPLPDVVFLDQRMPRISGLDVLCWIRTEPRFACLPVVILSGALSPSQRDMARRLKAATCSKGADPKVLMETIGHAVGSALGVTKETPPEPRPAPVLARARFYGAEPIRVWT